MGPLVSSTAHPPSAPQSGTILLPNHCLGKPLANEEGLGSELACQYLRHSKYVVVGRGEGGG